jgi:hypothetical protein
MFFEFSEFFVGAGFIIFYRFDEAKKTNSCEIGQASFCLHALWKAERCASGLAKKVNFKTLRKFSEKAEFSPWEPLKSIHWSKSSFLNFEKLQTKSETPVGDCSKSHQNIC